ncbi:MAG: NADP-dependent oxidoreductase [Cycloclasticus sp.]|nr:MAG: NADP-dependent oxidoreductase [Cycloclasticus sp.]
METKINRQWRLATRPTGLIKELNFEWHEEPVPSPGKDEILVRNLYLSLDPANRAWVREAKAYATPVAIGEVMRGIAIGVVEQSHHGDFQAGDIVKGVLGWQDYALTDDTALTKLPTLPIPLSAYFGVFGIIGPAAYFGLLEIGKPKAGETVVVSAAAGAVGSLVGQIAKIKGCRVVGIAGTDEKCRWMTEELGFDAAINYKTEPVHKRLKTHCPNGIDVFFDNVGGAILDDVLSLINVRARIAICGFISQYNAVEPEPGPYNFRNILAQRTRIEGFIIFDYIDRYNEAYEALGGWLAEGKIQYRVDVIDGLENAPSGINKLFDGSNNGKLIVKVSEEPFSNAAG